MFSFIGVRATPHGFMDLMPNPLLRGLLFEGLQCGPQHPGLCRDVQLLPEPFDLLLFFFFDAAMAPIMNLLMSPLIDYIIDGRISVNHMKVKAEGIRV